jgi:general secretion pathway protein B
MSFILDALKKSETDRQRQSGPALFEVRVAPPRNALPVWAMGLAVLLAVNLVIVAWALLRKPAPAEQAGAPVQVGSPLQTGGPVPSMTPQSSPGLQQAQTPSPAPGAVPVLGTAPAPPLAQMAGMAQQAAGAGTAGQPGGAAGVPPAGGNPPSGPYQQSSAYPQQPFNAAQQALNPGGMAANATQGPGAQTDAAGEKLKADDYAPAVDPPAPAPFGNHVTRSTSSGVPLYQDAALNSHLPNLRLDLHVYAAAPQERFVMINMHKLHEGDSLPEGVRVESITPDGAVLSQNGTKFLMPRE